jgi:hypothetical protein
LKKNVSERAEVSELKSAARIIGELVRNSEASSSLYALPSNYALPASEFEAGLQPRSGHLGNRMETALFRRWPQTSSGRRDFSTSLASIRGLAFKRLSLGVIEARDGDIS